MSAREYYQWQRCEDKDSFDDCDDETNADVSRLGIGTKEKIVTPVQRSKNQEYHIFRESKYTAVEMIYNKKDEKYESRSVQMRAAFEIKWIDKENNTPMSFDNIASFEAVEVHKNLNVTVNDLEYMFVRQSEDAGGLMPMTNLAKPIQLSRTMSKITDKLPQPSVKNVFKANQDDIISLNPNIHAESLSNSNRANMPNYNINNNNNNNNTDININMDNNNDLLNFDVNSIGIPRVETLPHADDTIKMFHNLHQGSNSPEHKIDHNNNDNISINSDDRVVISEFVNSSFAEVKYQNTNEKARPSGIGDPTDTKVNGIIKVDSEGGGLSYFPNNNNDGNNNYNNINPFENINSNPSNNDKKTPNGKPNDTPNGQPKVKKSAVSKDFGERGPSQLTLQFRDSKSHSGDSEEMYIPQDPEDTPQATDTVPKAKKQKIQNQQNQQNIQNIQQVHIQSGQNAGNGQMRQMGLNVGNVGNVGNGATARGGNGQEPFNKRDTGLRYSKVMAAQLAAQDEIPRVPIVIESGLLWQRYDYIRNEWKEMTLEWQSYLETTPNGAYCGHTWENKYQIIRKNADYAEIEVPEKKNLGVHIPGLVVNIPLRRICIDRGRNNRDDNKRRIIFKHTSNSEPYPTALKTEPVFGNNNKNLEKQQIKYLSNKSSYMPKKELFTEYCDFDAQTIKDLSRMDTNGKLLEYDNDLRKLTFNRVSDDQYNGMVKNNLNILEIDNNNNIAAPADNDQMPPIIDMSDGGRPTRVDNGNNRRINNNNNNNYQQQTGGSGYLEGFDNKLEFLLIFISDELTVEPGYIDPKIGLNTVEADHARDIMWKGWKFRIYSFTDPEFAFVFFMSLFDFISDVIFISLGYYKTDALTTLAILFVLLPLFAFLISHGHLLPVIKGFYRYCIDMINYNFGLKTDRTGWLRHRTETDSTHSINLAAAAWQYFYYPGKPVTLDNGRVIKYPRLTNVVVKLISVILQVTAVLIVGIVAIILLLIVLAFYAVVYIFDCLVVLIVILINIIKYLVGLIITIFILVYLKGGAWKYISRFYLFGFCGEQSVYFEWAFSERDYYYQYGCLRHENMECQCGGNAMNNGNNNNNNNNNNTNNNNMNRVGSISGIRNDQNIANDIIGNGRRGNNNNNNNDNDGEEKDIYDRDGRTDVSGQGRNVVPPKITSTDGGHLVKMLNVAIVCEVFVESLPQLIILSINQWGENGAEGDQNGDEEFWFWFSWITSLFMILNLGYAFSNYVVTGGLTWSQAFRTEIYPVNE